MDSSTTASLPISDSRPTSRTGSGFSLQAVLLAARNLVEYLAIPVVVLAAWELGSVTGFFPSVAVASPGRVAHAFWQLSRTGELPLHVVVSLLRVFQGAFVAATLGIGLGIGIGLSRRLERMADLVIELLRPIPPIAWIPLAILWFGIGEFSKVYVIFLGAFFPILINVVAGIRQTEHKFVEVARVLEVPRFRFIRYVIVPGALPVIMSSLRLGVGIAWMCVVAAELIAASRGVGYLIMDARALSQPDIVMVGMITIGIVGKVTDVGLKRLERWIVRWNISYVGE